MADCIAKETAQMTPSGHTRVSLEIRWSNT